MHPKNINGCFLYDYEIKKTKRPSHLKYLQQMPSFTIKEAVERGVSRSEALTRYTQKHERFSPGVYGSPSQELIVDFKWENLIRITFKKSITGWCVIFCSFCLSRPSIIYNSIAIHFLPSNLSQSHHQSEPLLEDFLEPTPSIAIKHFLIVITDPASQKICRTCLLWISYRSPVILARTLLIFGVIPKPVKL